MALTPPSLLHPITVTAPKPQCNLLPASSPSLLCPLIPNPLDAPSLPMSWWCSSRLLYTQGAMAVSPMQKLCLVKLVRPECLVAAIQQYVITSLGPRFAEPGPVSLQCVKKDSNNTTPIIFILSPGGPEALSPLIMFCSSAAWVVVVAVAVMVAVVVCVGCGFSDVSGGGSSGSRGFDCTDACVERSGGGVDGDGGGGGKSYEYHHHHHYCLVPTMHTMPRMPLLDLRLLIMSSSLASCLLPCSCSCTCYTQVLDSYRQLMTCVAAMCFSKAMTCKTTVASQCPINYQSHQTAQRLTGIL